MVKSLIDDINDSIKSDPFEGRPFFITVHEKRDLQMPNQFLRRLITTIYRPYPENNTLVFSVNPQDNEVLYCWDLPHHSEMWNILSNTHLYDPEYIKRIREWQNNDLTNFGFVKDPMGEHWLSNSMFKDKQMKPSHCRPLILS